MSIVTTSLEYKEGKVTNGEIVQDYVKTPEIEAVWREVYNAMVTGDMNMRTPRVEFNDNSFFDEISVRQQSFNTYQPNDGEPNEGDQLYGWRSRAIRPIVRNKVMSMAAHATKRLIMPGIHAVDKDNNEQKQGAYIMRNAIEWRCQQTDYAYNFVKFIIDALVNPVAYMYIGYQPQYTPRRVEENGKFVLKNELDENKSPFVDMVVQPDELFFENIYEPEIQNQSFVIWRKVISYKLASIKYGKEANWKYVRPGVQMLAGDANSNFYYVYDPNLSDDMVEEIHYWCKATDSYQVMVNGVLLKRLDNPNPRQDKKYPFVKAGFELINSRFYGYKSLVAKLGPDEKIINSIYPMVIDGTYLSIFPPMVATGGETIESDVIIPGVVTTLAERDSDLKAINAAGNMFNGLNALLNVENSVNQSSNDPLLSGNQSKGEQTAYEVARLEENAATVLGLFLKMIGKAVRDAGQLMGSDNLQYLTVGELKEVGGGSTDLVYKSFLLPNKKTESGVKSIKVEFDMNTPKTEEQLMEESFKILELEQKYGEKVQMYKVNPKLFRNLRFQYYVTDEILTPMSEQIQNAFNLELYDRAIANPYIDQEEVTRDFLLGSYKQSQQDPDRYMKKQEMGMPQFDLPAPGSTKNAGANNILANVAETAKSGALRA